MQIVATSLRNGQLHHEVIQLPEGFLDLSLEMDSGMIFQIVTEDSEDAIHISEKTFRHLSIEPRSANGIKVKGI